TASASGDPILLNRLHIPREPVARPLRHHREAVHDLERLCQDLVGPIHIFEEVGGGGGREQMRAYLGKTVRRHLDAVGGGEGGGGGGRWVTPPMRWRSGMTKPAAPAASATAMTELSEKFSPIWIGVLSSRTSVALPA